LWLKGQLVRTRGLDTHMKYFRLAATSPEATPAIWGKYGIELALLGQSAEAQTYLQRAIDGGATDLDVMCQLARIMIAQGRCAGANDLLMSAVRQPQAGWRAWKLLADAQRRLERPDDAAASVQQALSMLPKPYPPELAMDAAELLMSLGQLRLAAKRDTEAAEVFAVAANDYTPMRGEAAFEAAKCYHRLGRFAVAMRFIDIAAKLLPADDSVKQWVRTIEDSRFGPAGAGAAASAPAAPTATAPAGGTAPSVGR
jgi:tetratricopeptide (TPR) repeat protein